jgi:LAO/AO transport system kinase
LSTVDLKKLFSGDARSVARAITLVENGSGQAAELMKSVFPKTGRAQVIGVTGAPGAGKSSLVDKLPFYYRDAGH